jgi:hypothetical protein
MSMKSESEIETELLNFARRLTSYTAQVMKVSELLRAMTMHLEC